MDIAKLKELLGAADAAMKASQQADAENAFSVEAVDKFNRAVETANALRAAAVNALPSLIARVEAAEKVVEAAEYMMADAYRGPDQDDLRAALAIYTQESAK